MEFFLLTREHSFGANENVMLASEYFLGAWECFLGVRKHFHCARECSLGARKYFFVAHMEPSLVPGNIFFLPGIVSWSLESISCVLGNVSYVPRSVYLVPGSISWVPYLYKPPLVPLACIHLSYSTIPILPHQ